MDLNLDDEYDDVIPDGTRVEAHVLGDYYTGTVTSLHLIENHVLYDIEFDEEPGGHHTQSLRVPELYVEVID